ncbi:MAG TPA: hypothetical protein VL096_21305, partial [Pirellulaceae bacterium]|nr:hypothetical protein [Pirellulaceae bacterium]
LSWPVLLMSQKLIEVRFTGDVRLWGGYAATAVLGVLLALFAGVLLLRRDKERGAAYRHPRWQEAMILGVSTALLLANLWSEKLYGYTMVVQFGHALQWRLSLLAVWLAVAITLWRTQATSGMYALAICGLIAATRVSSLVVDPGNVNGGDMLSNIDRVFGLLLQGQFPYVDEPPPAMPYWPATLLVYLPARLIGCDLRWTNVVLEVATALIALVPCFTRQKRAAIVDYLVPMMMLVPIWTHYGINTQYAPTVLVAVLFGQAVLRSGLNIQGCTLGLAVATSQMFGLFGVCIGPWWWRNFGLRSAIMATIVSLIVCLAWVGPFLAWDSREFCRVTLESLDAIPDSQLAGRVTLRPLLVSMHPRLPLALALSAMGGVALLNVRYRLSRRAIVVALALAFYVVLILLHRTFTHYYLPVFALLALSPQVSCDTTTQSTS